MSGMSTADRDLSRRAHGLNGLTPASSSSSSQTGGPWKSNPTPIPLPGNLGRTTGPSFVTSPFTPGRMGNNLHTSRRAGAFGNHTARSTVFPPAVLIRTPLLPTSDRRQMSLVLSLMLEQETRKEVNKGSSQRSLSQWNDDEVIDIIGEDDSYKAPHIEHLTSETRRDGSEESSDPLDCIPKPLTTSHHNHRNDHSESQRSGISNQSAPRLPMDGDATLRLRKRLEDSRQDEKAEDPGGDHDENGADSIESFSDEPLRSLSSGPKPRPGSVQDLILKYQPIPMDKQPIPNRAPNRPPKNNRNAESIRTVDFSNQPKASRKDAMKPKQGAPKQGTPPRVTFGRSDDPLAASSGFEAASSRWSTQTAKAGMSTRSRKKTAGIPTKSFCLPLEGFSWGCTVCEDDVDILHPLYWFTWETSSDRLCIRKRCGKESPWNAEMQHVLRIDFSAWTYTDIPFRDDLPLVVSFKVPESRVNKADESLKFRPGSNGGDGMVTLKFMAVYPDTRENYSVLITCLKAAISYTNTDTNHVDGHGARAKWAQVQSTAEIAWNDLESSSRASSSGRLVRSKQNGSSKQQGDISTMISNQGMKTRSTARPTAKGATSESDVEARRSARLNTDPSPSPGPDELILVYPPAGAGAINVNKSDLKRLDDGCYLNDTLIEFGLKLWLADLKDKNPTFAEQVHVFSSFFYKKLNVKGKGKDEGYQSVRKWTSKIDLFQKKYIVVPINEHFHWYLAIICNPEHVLLPPLPSPPKPKPMTRKRKRDSDVTDVQATTDSTTAEAANAQDMEIVPDSHPPSPAIPVVDSGGEDEVEDFLLGPQESVADADESRPPSAMGDDPQVDRFDQLNNIELEYPRSSSAPPMEVDEPPSAQPVDMVIADDDISMDPSSFYDIICDAVAETTGVLSIEEDDHNRVNSLQSGETAHILFFDSLGSKHPQARQVLANYLQLEAKDKKGVEQSRLAQGKFAFVPSQPNYCDCGVYVLHFMRVFMENPEFYTNLILSQKSRGYGPDQRKADWKGDEVKTLRKELRERIVSMSDVWKADRQAREEARKKEASSASDTASGGPEPDVIDESDVEVVIEDTATSSKPGRRG
ncbi:uncharacterized protein B0H18DRAFT_1119406 [Fomitopsis serialis]|uniref:uncharacterized protein n=1 Tax=Fomitopsis serialis TaxID=139415 RepID=UPI0020071E16|nr:uncharacterized protein B0H18DRAFT_1119406 [Neoantrodia serialis]KAH9925567.1 hypothetical protein B0H18DRAFT_1119406 [Neoantrodia serialis]